MTNDEFRHKMTPEQSKLSVEELAKTLTPGTGVSVYRAQPYWDVVARLGEKGAVEFIVTDSSRPGQKPLRVHGPTNKAAAIRWATETAQLWRATHVFHIDDEPLGQFR